jgi:hypothetical protein
VAGKLVCFDSRSLGILLASTSIATLDARPLHWRPINYMVSLIMAYASTRMWNWLQYVWTLPVELGIMGALVGSCH